METKHTPGPWMQPLQANSVTIRHPHVISDNGEIAIATWQGSEQVTNANARLIAAAPELLEFAQFVFKEWGYDGYGNECEDGESEVIDKARAVIAKATTT